MNGPLDIGVQIWQGCKTQLQDKPTDETVQILRTFCDAYQGEILQKCKLSDLLVLNNYEEQINVKIWMTKFSVHIKSVNYVLTNDNAMWSFEAQGPTESRFLLKNQI